MPANCATQILTKVWREFSGSYWDWKINPICFNSTSAPMHSKSASSSSSTASVCPTCVIDNYLLNYFLTYTFNTCSDCMHAHSWEHFMINDITRPSIPAGAAVSVSPRPSVRPSRGTCLRFSRSRKAVETSNLLKTQRSTRLTRGANLRSKGQRSRSLGTKMWKSFLFISSTKVDRFMWNQDQNDSGPFYTMNRWNLNTFYQRKYFFYDNLSSVIIWEGRCVTAAVHTLSRCGYFVQTFLPRDAL